MSTSNIDGVVAVIPRANRLLVIRRSRHVVAPRMFCFPGGHLEADESEEDALVRELNEELAVTVKPQRRLWQSVTPWNVTLAWWLCESIEVEPTPNPTEVESYHWLGRSELARQADLLESNRDFMLAWQDGDFEVY